MRRWHRLDKKVSSQTAVAGKAEQMSCTRDGESANAVKAIVLIFQDECFSMESNSAAPFTAEPDYGSLQGDLAIHLFMLRAQPLSSTSCAACSLIKKKKKKKREGLLGRKCARLLYYTQSDGGVGGGEFFNFVVAFCLFWWRKAISVA